MAAFNVSLDDSSPLISYSPPNVWLDTPANDTLTKFYSAGSLHTTAVDGAAAHFSFNGTGVWLYGGLRPDYGFYTFLVDGVQVLQGDARAADPELGHILAGISGLPMGEHTVQLKNAGNGPIDLDTMVFETTVGASGYVQFLLFADGGVLHEYLRKSCCEGWSGSTPWWRPRILVSHVSTVNVELSQ